MTATATPPPGGKLVFVTERALNGNLRDQMGAASGIEGADAVCAGAAQAAGRSGTFVAWISDVSTEAWARITTDAPWYLSDGTTEVFAGVGYIPNGPTSPVNESVGGTILDDVSVWTGTNANGTQNPANCINWTDDTTTIHQVDGLVGTTGAGGWTDSEAISCLEEAHLYCFEL